MRRAGVGRLLSNRGPESDGAAVRPAWRAHEPAGAHVAPAMGCVAFFSMDSTLTLLAVLQQQDAAGSFWGPFFWFWLAMIAVILVFFLVRFSNRRRKPPIEPGA